MRELGIAKKVYDEITTHPELHDQGAFVKSGSPDVAVCDSPKCVAGWAVHFSKSYDIKFQPYEYPNAPEHSGYWLAWNIAEEKHMDFDDAAADVLGLDDKQADRLFYESNDAEAVAEVEELVRAEEQLDEVSSKR